MCWVFHLIGDAHQPLHVTQLFTTQFPKGDRGGNKFLIRAKEGASSITLHQYWDDLIIGSDRFQSVRNKATELRNRPELAKDKLHELKDEKFERPPRVSSWPRKSHIAMANCSAAPSWPMRRCCRKTIHTLSNQSPSGESCWPAIGSPA
jgi:hypothetical protein